MQGTGTKGQHSLKRPLPAGRSYADRTSPNRAGLVSVIIPAYNAAATVERTVSSVLNQTYSDLEVLVVDDGSTDQTAALVQSMADVDHRIRLLQKPNGGLASARNPSAIEPERPGVDLDTFRCAVCNHVLTTLAAHEDPMHSQALGRWLLGDLHPAR